MAIIQNRSQGHAVTSDIANAVYVLADFGVPNGTIETVTGFAITKIFWTGDWTIKRANTVVFQTANNTGVWDLNKTGISLINSANVAANLSINTTSSAASLILGISKTSSTTANTW